MTTIKEYLDKHEALRKRISDEDKIIADAQKRRSSAIDELNSLEALDVSETTPKSEELLEKEDLPANEDNSDNEELPDFLSAKSEKGKEILSNMSTIA
jgi:hypothetical protein